MAVAKRRVSKADKWLNSLTNLSIKYGVVLVELYDGAKVLDGKRGTVLGTNLANICGIYTSHRPKLSTSKKTQKPHAERDVHGFATELNALCELSGVTFAIGAAPVMLADIDSQEPLGMLVHTPNGYEVRELQPV